MAARTDGSGQEMSIGALGPLRIDDPLPGGWRIAQLDRHPAEARITIAHDDGGEAVVFVLPGVDGPREQAPFHPNVEMTYRSTSRAYASFEEAGKRVAQKISSLGDDPRSAVSEWLGQRSEIGWRDHARSLVDQLGRRVRLADVEPLRHNLACVLPWTRLELGSREVFGPCCNEFHVAPARSDAPLLDAWRSEPMQAFRRALAADTPSSTCRESCPRLAGRSDALDTFELRGGPTAFIDNQIRVAEAMLSGTETTEATPLELCFPVTTFCNYDCLMCECGQVGRLDDERDEVFYEAVVELLPGLAMIDALGGEPLASPKFRSFLIGDALRENSHVEMALTTNGSYLSPSFVERSEHVRFASITVSLNAASPETYRSVNRGLAMDRIRPNLDALLARRARGTLDRLTYSFVILKRNLHEVRAFAELAQRDGVSVRYMLPMGNRNDESVLTDEAAMRRVEADLRAVSTELRAVGDELAARRAEGEASVLATRLAAERFAPLPDDDALVQLR